jgi:hypothetical protein
MTPQPVPYVEPIVDEKIWNAWLTKGRLREQADDRRNKRLAAVFLILLLVAGAVTWLVRP